MKPSRWQRFQFSAGVICSLRSELSAPEFHTDVVEIALHEKPPTEIPVNPDSREYSAAVKIQSAYRSHLVRKLVRKISAVNSEAGYWQRLLQRQDTVDAVRGSEKERLKINEGLMKLLLQLDSVPGIDPNVRELRRYVSRKVVGLQEILDAVTDSRNDDIYGISRNIDDMVARIEKQACTERGGGYEMERFCAQHLGFRCLQRFLSDQ